MPLGLRSLLSSTVELVEGGRGRTRLGGACDEVVGGPARRWTPGPAQAPREGDRRRCCSPCPDPQPQGELTSAPSWEGSRGAAVSLRGVSGLVLGPHGHGLLVLAPLPPPPPSKSPVFSRRWVSPPRLWIGCKLRGRSLPVEVAPTLLVLRRPCLSAKGFPLPWPPCFLLRSPRGGQCWILAQPSDGTTEGLY